jgi:hypothetical protein
MPAGAASATTPTPGERGCSSTAPLGQKAPVQTFLDLGKPAAPTNALRKIPRSAERPRNSLLTHTNNAAPTPRKRRPQARFD